jgi:hypothetical protein
MGKPTVDNQAISLQRGEIVQDRYEIVRTIAQKANHSVYEAVDLTAQSPVALKVLTTKDQQTGKQWDAIVQTVESIRATRHTGLITVFDLFHDRHGAVIVEEWIRGAPLLTLLRSRPLTPFDVIHMLCSLAHGIDYLREQHLPDFGFSLRDLFIHAPSAPEGEWLHLPLKTWNAFELKVDPLPLENTSPPSAPDSFIGSFTATLYQMLGGRLSQGLTTSKFRPLVSLEESGNQVLRDYINGNTLPRSCEEILLALAKAEEIELGSFQQTPISRPVTEIHLSRQSTALLNTPDKVSAIGDAENAIAAKEAEILGLKQALERQKEEKRLAELQSKLEQSFVELEEERARFQRQVADERHRLNKEGDRLQLENERLVTEKARQEELKARLDNLQEDFEQEKAQANREIERRRTELDQRHDELQHQLQELQERDAGLKKQQATMERQEIILTERSCELNDQQRQRESELTQSAELVEAERVEVEKARHRLAEEQTALEQQRKRVSKESEELTKLDRALAAQHIKLTEREHSVQADRERLKQSQHELEANRQSFESESAALEKDLANKEHKLERLRLVHDRSTAQQAHLDQLEGAKQEIEAQRIDLQKRRVELESQNTQQSARLEKLIDQHEQDIAHQRNELSTERDRYRNLSAKLTERESEVQIKAEKQRLAQEQLTDARSKLQEREIEADQLRREMQRLESEQEQQRLEHDAFQEQIVGLKNKVNQLEEDQANAARAEATQRKAVAEVEQEQEQVEIKLRVEFERREQLLEQQKAAADHQLKQSEQRVQALHQQEEAIRSREKQINQREANAGQLESLVEQERTARESEAQLRLAAEKKSRTLWTKTAIAATLGILLLGIAGWAWLEFGRTGSMLREKQLLTDLQAEDNAVIILNRARVFVEDDANQSNDYTLDTGFSKDLRLLLESAIDSLLTRHTSNLSQFEELAKQVNTDSTLEPPRGFINRLGQRVRLSNAKPLKLRLDQLASQQRIANLTDPYAKAAAAAQFSEAFPNVPGNGDAFRNALNQLSSLAPIEITRALTHLDHANLKHAPAPAPLLDTLIGVAVAQTLPDNGFTEQEIKVAATLFSRLLDFETELSKASSPESINDRTLTLTLLNRLSRTLRDSYGAMTLHVLDKETHVAVTRMVRPIIDHMRPHFTRLIKSDRQNLVETLSLVAEMTIDQRLIETILEGDDYPLPAAMWRLQALYERDKRSSIKLERLAITTVKADPSHLSHGRTSAQWESYTRSVKAHAYRQLAVIKFDQGLHREGEQHLLSGLRLHSEIANQFILPLFNYLVALGKPLATECVHELKQLTISAYSRLPVARRESFIGSLSPPEQQQVSWLTEGKEAIDQSWGSVTHIVQGTQYLVQKRIPPFANSDPALAERLDALFSAVSE